jgi:hypothetical protein
MLGFYPKQPPSFVRQYETIAEKVRAAFAAYAADVRSGQFPRAQRAGGLTEQQHAQSELGAETPSHSFSMPDAELGEWLRLSKARLERSEHPSSPFRIGTRRSLHTLSRSHIAASGAIVTA